MAARATAASGYESSNSTRPGLTTATHISGLPLPEPMRVSAGFWVTGLSGNTLIHTLPPRLMWRVMALRAASIFRAVTHPGSSAWIPYSPKLTSLPPLATPVMRPRWCLRCATLRGISMSLVPRPEVRRLVVVVHPALDLFLFGQQALELGIGLLDEGLVLGRLLGLGALGRPAPAGGRRRHDALLPGGRRARTRGLTHGHGGLAGDLVRALTRVGQDVALVDPHLHADAAGGGAGLAEAVVDVGAQRVPRHAALEVALGACHLAATQAAGALHLDALRAGLLSVLHGALHRPPEGHAGRQLVGHALGDQRRVELGLLDLLDVELDLGIAGDLGQAGAQPVGLAASTADHDARAGRVDVDAQAVTGALDLDAADGRVRQLAHQVVAHLPVLDDVVAVGLAVGEPPRLPVGGDAEAKAVRVDLLAHVSSSPRRRRRRPRASRRRFPRCRRRSRSRR